MPKKSAQPSLRGCSELHNPADSLLVEMLNLEVSTVTSHAAALRAVSVAVAAVQISAATLRLVSVVVAAVQVSPAVPLASPTAAAARALLVQRLATHTPSLHS